MSQAFRKRLVAARNTRNRCERSDLVSKAREIIPGDRLLSQAAAKTGGEGLPHTLPLDPACNGEFRDAFAKELLAWFKNDFFSWVDAPKCESCSSKSRLVQTGPPLDDERGALASIVEIYECTSCGAWQRFPRYNCPGKLLETRRGRCGEWANCFTLICVAAGLEVRYISDWTDHVWVEIWSDHLNKWAHADSCENAFDSPLMYEQGWGKKLSYVVAAGLDHMIDVTRKYTKNYAAVKSNRTENEKGVQMMVENQHLVQHYDYQVKMRFETEQRRKTLERLIMEQVVMYFSDTENKQLSDAEQQGRISGDAQWRHLRGEDGTSK